MPDDDLSQRELCYRIGAGRKTVVAIAADLGIEPRRSGSSAYYTVRQAAAIEVEHSSRALRKSGPGSTTR
jgi:hypothetical protein